MEDHIEVEIALSNKNTLIQVTIRSQLNDGEPLNIGVHTAFRKTLVSSNSYWEIDHSVIRSSSGFNFVSARSYDELDEPLLAGIIRAHSNKIIERTVRYVFTPRTIEQMTRILTKAIVSSTKCSTIKAKLTENE